MKAGAPATMLDSLRISGFRAFPELTVQRVGRVNLVVGRNNVGKTTLLEAMHLHASGRNVFVAARRMLKRRDEYLGEDLSTVDLERLFYQHNGTRSEAFTIANGDGRDQLEVTRTWAWWDHAEPSRSPITGDDPPPEVDAEHLFIARRQGQNDIRLSGLPRNNPLSGTTGGGYFDSSRPMPSLLLPLSGFQTEAIDPARFWDGIVLTDREDRVIEALRVIEPNIERIVMVDRKGRRRSAVAKVRGRSPIPLRSLGDGMNRLFELAVGLVSVEGGGTFLVDEVDSGLHFTTLVDVWRLIFEAAARLDVQVFGTTHSWDCIQAFQQAAMAYPAQGVLVRLQRAGDAIVSEVFTEEDLSVITRESIEVR
jgi:AAA domain, putative AbiEii toxin, Type IV TA system